MTKFKIGAITCTGDLPCIRRTTTAYTLGYTLGYFYGVPGEIFLYMGTVDVNNDYWHMVWSFRQEWEGSIGYISREDIQKFST